MEEQALIESMDRKLLKLPFLVKRSPDWMCPTCEKGVLRFKEGTFKHEELAASRDHSANEWEPDWIRYVYSALLVCTNDKCKEVVATAGNMRAHVVGILRWYLEAWGVGYRQARVQHEFLVIEASPPCVVVSTFGDALVCAGFDSKNDFLTGNIHLIHVG
jgi:hypothetical protein